MLSLRTDLSSYWGSFVDVSNQKVVCQDPICGVSVYSIQDRTQIKVIDYIFGFCVAMDDPWIVWADKNGVSAFDLRDSGHYCLSKKGLLRDVPVIDETTAVWVEEDDVIGYNLETKTRFTIVSGWNRQEYQGEKESKYVSPGLTNPRNPDIHGDIVVWVEEHTKTTVVGYNLRSKERFVIRESPYKILHPRVSDNFIVWKEKESEKPNERLCTIMEYDLRNKTLKTICSGINSEFDIDINGDLVVWDDYRDKSDSDIFGHNLSTGKTFRICSSSGNQFAPKISDCTVIWCDGRSQDWLDKLLKKERHQIYGKIFRHWPGEEE